MVKILLKLGQTGLGSRVKMVGQSVSQLGRVKMVGQIRVKMVGQKEVGSKVGSKCWVETVSGLGSKLSRVLGQNCGSVQKMPFFAVD